MSDNSARIRMLALRAAAFAALAPFAICDAFAAEPVGEEKPSSDRPDSRAKTKAMEGIVVTGTRLKVGTTEGPQDVQVYTRERIDESGQTTISGFLNTLPDVSVSFTEGGSQSRAGETSVRLHGMPSGTTLVLINGRRVQDSAITLGTSFATNFFDLNNIPLSAVDRIEVLPEGASAIYGSDAIAGVVNIVLKKNLSGTEASVRYSHAASLDQWDADLAFGRQWTGGAFMLIGSLQKRDSLDGADRAVTATQDHHAQGIDTRSLSCPTPNIFGIGGAALPGLGVPYAAVPAGYAGPPSIAQFAGTAGTLNKCSLGALKTYVPKTQREGMYAQGYVEGPRSVQLFGEMLASHVKNDFRFRPASASATLASQAYTVPANNPYNPFGTRVGIGGVFADSPQSFGSDANFFRPVVGLRGDFARDWEWETAAMYARDHETYTSGNLVQDRAGIQAAFNAGNPALNPFIDAPLGSPEFTRAYIHDYVQQYTAYDMGAEGFARGTLFRLPAGAVQAVVGAEYHDYRLYTDNGNYANVVYGPPGTPTTYSRKSYAVFGEARVPIVPGSGSLPNLEAIAAVRHDHYDDFGGTTNPQYALEWRPINRLMVRATYGETFRAPPLYDLYSPRSQISLVLNDPQRGNRQVVVTGESGGNPALQPETGKSESFGIQYGADAVRGLHATVTWWRIKEKNNIQSIPAQTLVNNEGVVPGAVVRDAAGNLVLVSAVLQNFGEIKVEGISSQVAYTYPSALGLWTPSIAATYTYRYDVQLTPGAPTISGVSKAQDTNLWAPRWKGLAALGWRQGPASITGTARYVGPYGDYSSTRRIGDVWYFDLNAKYAFPKSTFGDVYVELGGINIFDRQAQVSNNTNGNNGFDPGQYDIRGRVIYARLGSSF